MPELPEAETIARDLRRRIVGSTIQRVAVPRPDILAPPLTPRRFAARVRGHRITASGRRAKKVVLTLDNERRIIFHLGMTGRIMAGDAAGAGELRHIVVRLDLDGGWPLLFDDTRRFGLVEVVDSADWDAWSAALGPEPLSRAFTAAALFTALRGSRAPVRNWLLDQKRIAGIGNIYACEALFRAGVRPGRRARSLTRNDAAALHTAIRDVLRAAIRARGTSFRDYRDGHGRPGGFQLRLGVYDREGQPCPICGAAVRRIVLAGRSAFFCPLCQR